MSAHIHTYTYIYTHIQNVHMNARKHAWNDGAAANARGAVGDAGSFARLFRSTQSKHLSHLQMQGLHCTHFLKHQYPSTSHPLFPTYPRTVRGPRARAVLLFYTDQMNRVHSSEEAPRSLTMASCVVVQSIAVTITQYLCVQSIAVTITQHLCKHRVFLSPSHNTCVNTGYFCHHHTIPVQTQGISVTITQHLCIHRVCARTRQFPLIVFFVLLPSLYSSAGTATPPLAGRVALFGIRKCFQYISAPCDSRSNMC